MTPLTSVLRQINRNGKKLNILCADTHERYQTGMCKTRHNFFSLQHKSFKKWDTKFAGVPTNYKILEGDSLDDQLNTLDGIDIVLSQNKFGQYQVLSQVARAFNCPFISLEHTLPMSDWPQKRKDRFKILRADLDLFISKFSINQWGFPEDNRVDVVHHGIDTEKFSGWNGGDGKILTVVNDYIRRDWCVGFRVWKASTQGLPVNPVGLTPGLSEPAKDIDDLVSKYQKCSVFLNTSLISPIPTSLLEAMSIGCPVVSTNTCMIPEIVENGINGFISGNTAEIKDKLRLLINNPDTARRMGEKARETILNRFSETSFVNKWNEIFSKMSNINPLTWC